MNMNYNYPTAIFRSIFAQNVQISGRKIYTLNNTSKCAHINGLISPLIQVRSFSNFNKYKRHVCNKIAYILFRIE